MLGMTKNPNGEGSPATIRPLPQPLSKGEGEPETIQPHPQPLSKGEGSPKLLIINYSLLIIN